LDALDIRMMALGVRGLYVAMELRKEAEALSGMAEEESRHDELSARYLTVSSEALDRLHALLLRLHPGMASSYSKMDIADISTMLLLDVDVLIRASKTSNDVMERERHRLRENFWLPARLLIEEILHQGASRSGEIMRKWMAGYTISSGFVPPCRGSKKRKC
jgi:hypothetical protein